MFTQTEVFFTQPSIVTIGIPLACLVLVAVALLAMLNGERVEVAIPAGLAAFSGMFVVLMADNILTVNMSETVTTAIEEQYAGVEVASAPADSDWGASLDGNLVDAQEVSVLTNGDESFVYRALVDNASGEVRLVSLADAVTAPAPKMLK